MQSTESNNKSLRFIKFKELLNEAITVIDEKFERGGEQSGYGFGTNEFDKNLGKIPMVGLTTIASKDTSVSQTFVSKTVIKQTFVDKQKIAVVNLDCMSLDYTSMLIAQVSGIPVEQVLSGNIEDDYWTNLTSSITVLDKLSLYVLSSPLISINRLCKEIKAMKILKNINLFVIDDLSLIKGEEKEIAMQLRKIAYKYRIAIVGNYRTRSKKALRQSKMFTFSDLVIFINENHRYHKVSIQKAMRMSHEFNFIT